MNAAAPGDTIGTLTVTLRGDAVVGSTAALILDPGSAMLSNQAGSVRRRPWPRATCRWSTAASP